MCLCLILLRVLKKYDKKKCKYVFQPAIFLYFVVFYTNSLKLWREIVVKCLQSLIVVYEIAL